MIIAVDFDGTIEIDGEPNIALFTRLKNEQKQGNTVILWTCRAGKRLNEAVQFMRLHGVCPNFVNVNAPWIVHQFGYDSRKIFADVYIDDKAVKI